MKKYFRILCLMLLLASNTYVFSYDFAVDDGDYCTYYCTIKEGTTDIIVELDLNGEYGVGVHCVPEYINYNGVNFKVVELKYSNFIRFGTLIVPPSLRFLSFYAKLKRLIILGSVDAPSYLDVRISSSEIDELYCERTATFSDTGNPFYTNNIYIGSRSRCNFIDPVAGIDTYFSPPIKNIFICREEPPRIDCSIDVTCNVYIPEGCRQNYSSEEPWNKLVFYHEGLEYEPTFATAYEFNKIFILTTSVKRWEYSRDGGLTWTNIDWVNNLFYEMNPEPGEVLYRILQEDGNYSDIVTVTYVEEIPKEIATTPNSLTKVVNEKATFSIDKINDNFSYQWYHNGNAIDNAVSHTYTIESVKSSHAGEYYCNVYNEISSTNSSIAKLVVNKASQVITFPEIESKRYGDPDFYLPEKTDKGLPIVYQSTNKNVATIDKNKVHICGIGETIISANQIGDDDYLEANPVSRKLVVKGQLQTIVWGELPEKTYEDAPFTLPKTTDKGIQISYTSSNTNVASISGNVVTIVGAGTCEIVANALGNSTYDAAETVKRTLVVNRQTQNIIFPDIETIEYGGERIQLSQYTDKGLKIIYNCSNAVASIDNYKLHVNLIGSVTITAYQQGNNNYEPVTIKKEITVIKGNQKIVWEDPLSFYWGDADVKLPERTNQGLLIEYKSANDDIVEINGNVMKIKSVGTTQITAKQPGNSYYNSATAVIRTVTVNKRKQIVTLNELPEATYGQKDHIQLYATTNSSSKIIFESSDQSIAQIDVDKIVVVGAGSCEIYAYALEDEHYEASDLVKQTLIVNKADQSISYTPIKEKVYGDEPFMIDALSSSNLPITYVLSASTPNVISINENEITILNSGTAKIQLQQLGDKNYNSAVKDITITIGKAPLIVTPINSTRLYGEDNPIFNLDYEGFVNGDTDASFSKKPIPNTIANVNSNVGVYVVNVSGGESANYNLYYQQGTLIVNKAPLTIKAEDKCKEYGVEIPELTLSIDELRNDDTIEDLDQLPAISCNVDVNSEPGVYPIVLSGGADNNYDYNLIDGLMTVKEKIVATLITLDQVNLYLKTTEIAKLVAIIMPETTFNKKVIWSSTNESVATVNTDGEVIAHKVGTATITATTTDGSNLSATCVVTVEPTPATNITLDQTVVTLKATESVTLTATVLPETATDKVVVWSSSDESVATVTDGEVTAVSIGEAIITVSTIGNSKLSASCKVVVMPTLAYYIEVTPNVFEAKENSQLQLSVMILPEETTNKDVIWSTSNEPVATVDQTGLVKVLKAGSATITASTIDGSNLSATCQIKVVSGIESAYESNVLITTADNVIMISNLPQGCLVKVFSIDGMVVWCEKSVGEIIKIDTPVNGLYLVQMDNKIIKVKV